jgi:hypothetical protein
MGSMPQVPGSAASPRPTLHCQLALQPCSGAQPWRAWLTTDDLPALVLFMVHHSLDPAARPGLR